MAQKADPNLLSHLRRLFGSAAQQDVAVGARTSPPRPSPHADPRRAKNAEQMNRQGAGRLDEVIGRLSPDKSVVGGKISLLNIGDVKERLGQKWPRYADRVHYIVSETLQRRLTEKDFFARTDEETYVVVFHDSCETEAKLKCALLGQEISKKFFGETENEADCSLQVETVVATVDGGFAREGVSLAEAMADALAKAEETEANQARRLARKKEGLSMEEVQELLGTAEQRLEDLERKAQDAKDFAIVRDSMRELVRELRNIESALASPDQSWIDLQTEPNSSQNAGLAWKNRNIKPVEMVRQIITRADERIETSEKSIVWVYDDVDSAESALNLDISYAPIWSVGQQRVGLYLCRTAVKSLATASGPGPGSADVTDLKSVDVIDRIVLRRAKSDLQTITSEGRASVIVIPVHFSTLNRPCPTENYLRICHAIPPELRKMIVWEIRGAPLRGWTTRLTQIVAVLRPLGRAVFALCNAPAIPSPGLHHVFSRLASQGVQGVGLDLAAYSVPEAEIIAYLEQFGTAAKKHKLSAYLYGVDTLSLNSSAVCSGFNHVSGSAIAGPLPKPRGLYPKALETVYLPID